MSPRWDKRLRLPKSDGGATICEKHEFIEAHFRDPEMSWEVDQALTQAKDDGKRMESRIQELGEEANSLEEALQEMEADRDALRAELDASHDGEDALRSEVARLRAQVAALQAEDRRVGPDEVVVPRSATEYAVRAFDWIDCPDPEHYEALRSFHDALRTSAQAHNGEGAKYKGPSGTTDGGGCMADAFC